MASLGVGRRMTGSVGIVGIVGIALARPLVMAGSLLAGGPRADCRAAVTATSSA